MWASGRARGVGLGRSSGATRSSGRTQKGTRCRRTKVPASGKFSREVIREIEEAFQVIGVRQPTLGDAAVGHGGLHDLERLVLEVEVQVALADALRLDAVGVDGLEEEGLEVQNLSFLFDPVGQSRGARAQDLLPHGRHPRLSRRPAVALLGGPATLPVVFGPVRQALAPDTAEV